MPKFKVTDPTTGRTVTLQGESAPTEQELEEIFSQISATSTGGSQQPPASAPASSSPQPMTWRDFGNREKAGPLVNQAVTGYQASQPQPHADQGFMAGLTGQSSTDLTPQDLHDRGLAAVGDLFSAENAGALTRNAAAIGAATKGGPILQMTGRGMQRTAEAMGQGPVSIMLRALTGGSVGGFKAGVAAAVTPPLMRAGGRLMERTGDWMSSPPLREGQVMEPPQAPGANRPMPKGPGPVQEGSFTVDQPGQPAGASRPPLQLPPARSTQMGPSSEPPPTQPFAGAAQPQPSSQMAMPQLDMMQQQAMLDALQGPAPLGSLPAGQSPRVTSWKPGYGPSAGDAATMREAYGSKQAGSLLKTRGDQIKALTSAVTSATSDTSPQLPSQTAQQISTQFATLTPEQQSTYLASAPNSLVRQLLDSLMQLQQQTPQPSPPQP